MRRTFYRGFIICALPCLLAAYFAFFGKYKLGIDLAGGTILVYEINLERSQERQKTQEASGDRGQPGARGASSGAGLSTEEMQRLAAAIKRRIDPADLKNVTVRPLGDNRIEIILPTSGGTQEKAALSQDEIEEVKKLISQVGVLEFRILANETDDGPAIAEAKQIIDNASRESLEARARKGLPPEAPPGEFDVLGQKVRYAWTELGREERETLGLSNANEKNPSGLWQRLAASRFKTDLQVNTQVGDTRDKRSSYLLYSQPVMNEATLTGEKADQQRLEREGKAESFNPKKIEYYVLTRVSPSDNVKVAGDVTLTARADQDRSFNPAVSFTFNSSGANLFGKMTERNKPDNEKGVVRNLAILLDDKVVSAPSLNAVITSSGQISGKFDLKSVNQLVTILRSGALTAELRDKPVSENTIGPTLGADTIRRGVLAVGLAFAAVLAFMVVYYRFAGLVACVALLANLLLTVGFMVAVNAAFTLPGLAGIVLMLGMAVDANVLIYERLREERNKGANLITAIRNGYDRAFPTIIDTHLSSIFTAIVLYTFGNDNLKGFSISLTVGLIISLFTSLYMTRLMFDFWLRQGWLKQLRMMRLFERPNIDFMGIRNYMFAFTALLTIGGFVLFGVRGEKNLNVDFTKGAVYGGVLRSGEERALTKVGDKLGLRDMLDRDHQDKRLKVESVRWLNEPNGDSLGAKKAAVNEYIYEITYAGAGKDGKPEKATISLSSPPEGNTVEEMNKDVAARASHLPDASVEQVFLTGEAYPDNKCKHFTVRTTEKEPELVQVALDRLLRDDKSNDPLMAAATMTYSPVTGPRVKLEFSDETSPNYVRGLLERSFRLKYALDELGNNSFELTDDKSESLRTGGKYKTMYLDVAKNPKFSHLVEKSKAASELAAVNAVRLPAAGLLGGVAFVESTDAAAGGPEAETETRTLEDILNQTKETFDSRPIPERLETFDSQLASETRRQAFLAIFYSWLAILLYLWFRFGNWTFGAAAVVCLIHDLCFTLGCIAACHYVFDTWFGVALGLQDFKIDLTTVAALLTLVGYSVNDTIVVFDRIREVRGKNPTLTVQMINDSINQTLSRTVLASLTVFLVVTVLYIFGGEGVHLFAFVMMVGVLVGTYSSIYVASPLLLIFGEGRAHTTLATTKKEPAKV